MLLTLSVRGCAVSEAWGRNRTAVELTIAALQKLGRLTDVDEARVAIVRALADAVDVEPINASLWREFRAAELHLRETTDSDDDDFTALLASLSSEVGDPPKAGTRKSRG